MSDYSIVADIPSERMGDPISVLELSDHAAAMLAGRKYLTVGDVATTLDQCPAALIASWQSGAHTVTEITYKVGCWSQAMRLGHLPTHAAAVAATGHNDGQGWATTVQQAPAAPQTAVEAPKAPEPTGHAYTWRPPAYGADSVPVKPRSGDDIRVLANGLPAAMREASFQVPVNGSEVESVPYLQRALDMVNSAVLDALGDKRTSYVALLNALNVVAPSGWYFGPRPTRESGRVLEFAFRRQQNGAGFTDSKL